MKELITNIIIAGLCFSGLYMIVDAFSKEDALTHLKGMTSIMLAYLVSIDVKLNRLNRLNRLK